MKTAKNISITMPPGMAKEAEKLAKKEGRTMSELLREAFRRYSAQTQSPIYSEWEIVKNTRATRDQLWDERYGNKIKSISRY